MEMWDWKVEDQGAGGVERWCVVEDMVRVRRRWARRWEGREGVRGAMVVVVVGFDGCVW